LAAEDFDFEKKLSNSSIWDHYIPLPKKIECPAKITVIAKGDEYQCRMDNRRRLFVKELFTVHKCSVGTVIKLTRQNNKYFFSVVRY